MNQSVPSRQITRENEIFLDLFRFMWGRTPNLLMVTAGFSRLAAVTIVFEPKHQILNRCKLSILGISEAMYFGFLHVVYSCIWDADFVKACYEISYFGFGLEVISCSQVSNLKISIAENRVISCRTSSAFVETTARLDEVSADVFFITFKIYDLNFRLFHLLNYYWQSSVSLYFGISSSTPSYLLLFFKLMQRP